ncbi:ORF6N domain-containing protein [uncultured Clostridium sp.]|uniref:ORF6N domain-containing protein n=1 Tax=uncultured Clostridium sp. TaxID=59620 RepID=UPI0028F10AE6|nr:ORF6N domain-containing protein [uncultured Clostridium sp.]
MNELIVKGIKNIEGMKFHEIEGGFGKDKKAMLVKEIANIHEREAGKINELINNNKSRFKNGIDIIDLKGTNFDILLKENGIYTQNALNVSKNVYLLSERGYSKLLKILEDDVAWEQYEKLVDGYFNMRAREKEKALNTSELSPELQMFKQIFDTVAKQQLEHKQIKAEIKETKEEIQGIRDIAGLSSVDWKTDSKNLIVKIAQKLGGNQFIQDVYKEIYTNLEKRAGCQLEIRLTNKRRRMAEEGICKSKRDKLNKLDVIGEDKKILECFLAITKEIAIKYGV